MPKEHLDSRKHDSEDPRDTSGVHFETCSAPWCHGEHRVGMLQEQLELLGLTRTLIVARCEIDRTVR